MKTIIYPPYHHINNDDDWIYSALVNPDLIYTCLVPIKLAQSGQISQSPSLQNSFPFLNTTLCNTSHYHPRPTSCIIKMSQIVSYTRAFYNITFSKSPVSSLSPYITRCQGRIKPRYSSVWFILILVVTLLEWNSHILSVRPRSVGSYTLLLFNNNAIDMDYNYNPYQGDELYTTGTDGK